MSWHIVNRNKTQFKLRLKYIYIYIILTYYLHDTVLICLCMGNVSGGFSTNSVSKIRPCLDAESLHINYLALGRCSIPAQGAPNTRHPTTCLQSGRHFPWHLQIGDQCRVQRYTPRYCVENKDLFHHKRVIRSCSCRILQLCRNSQKQGAKQENRVLLWRSHWLWRSYDKRAQT